MDWEDVHLTQEVRPTTRTGSVSEAMGSPMGAHDPRWSTVASVAGEEECRGSRTPGTESHRPPPPPSTREATLALASAGVMTSGRSHFGEESLRSKRGGHARAANVYDSLDDDEVTVRSPPIAGRGVGTPPPARRGREPAAVVTLAPNVRPVVTQSPVIRLPPTNVVRVVTQSPTDMGRDSECLPSTEQESLYPFRDGEEVAVQPVCSMSVTSRARGRSASQVMSPQSQPGRGVGMPSPVDVEPGDQAERGVDATQRIHEGREGVFSQGSNSDRALMAQMLQSQKDLVDAVSQVRREMSKVNHRVNYMEDQWASSSVISSRSEVSRV